MTSLRASTVAFLVAAAASALILGALGFEYLGHMPPCEMCMWQRYPHFAAMFIGIGVFLSVRASLLSEKAAAPAALFAAMLVALSGAIGIYHAGVEWQWWPGPQACTGNAFHAAVLDLNAPVVRCDRAAFRLFGLSLAGYNAIFSLTIAGAGVYALTTRKRRS